MNLIKSKELAPTELPFSTIQKLCYCQLADGNTLLHHLFNNKEAIEYIYQAAASFAEDGCDFFVPLLKNREGLTALDLALRKSNG